MESAVGRARCALALWDASIIPLLGRRGSCRAESSLGATAASAVLDPEARLTQPWHTEGMSGLPARRESPPIRKLNRPSSPAGGTPHLAAPQLASHRRGPS